MNRRRGCSLWLVSVYRHNSRNEKGKSWQQSKSQIQTQVKVQGRLHEPSQPSVWIIHTVCFIVLFTTFLLLIACRGRENKSIMSYLVSLILNNKRSEALMRKRETVLLRLFLAGYEMYKAKARGKVSLLCLPSQWRNSEIRQMVQMTFEKITISRFAWERERRQEGGRERERTEGWRVRKARRGLFLYSEG